jgi:hypothetical protein
MIERGDKGRRELQNWKQNNQYRKQQMRRIMHLLPFATAPPRPNSLKKSRIQWVNGIDVSDWISNGTNAKETCYRTDDTGAQNNKVVIF